MPVAVAWLLDGLWSILRVVIGADVIKAVLSKILAALGLGVVSLVGVNALISWAISSVQSEFVAAGSTSSLLFQLIQISDLGSLIAAISGGYTCRWAIRGLSKIMGM